MGKQSKRTRKARINNPPRGAPGILVVSETGRETKCSREALEILRHYYYKSIDVAAPISIIVHDKNDVDPEQDASNLSLEEEIAMMQKGASADAVLAGTSDSKGKAPFRVYDTGCKGTVFVMCTIPHCELIETTISTAKDKHYNNAENKASEDTKTASTGQDGSISGNDDGNGDVSKNDSECNSGGKRKQDKGVGLNENTESNPKKQKIDDANGETKWDPISTVQSIFADIREQNTEAPRSRFVNRMVPMQATCFASMEEIKANVRELLKTFLLPKGVEYGKRIEEGTANDDGTASLPSFKIEFKRRNCNHIRREQVVECVAGIIQKLTDDHWNNLSNDGASSTETKQEAKKPLFRVDLTDPKYTIIIEICRTLCGMSVVSNATSFKKFNLLMAQGEVDALNGDEAKHV